MDDYKRVMSRKPKEKDSDMLSLTVKPVRSRKGTVAPYDGETELSLRDLEDDSVGTKESPLNDRLTLGDLGKVPDKGTFVETEMSYRGGNDDDEQCIVDERATHERYRASRKSQS